MRTSPKTLLITSFITFLLFALAAEAAAQTQGQQSEATTVISSNGPVVAGFGKNIPDAGNTAETHIAKEVRHELVFP